MSNQNIPNFLYLSEDQNSFDAGFNINTCDETLINFADSNFEYYTTCLGGFHDFNDL